jgi:ubiquinone biosynthesis monooxygenase Coq7
MPDGMARVSAALMRVNHAGEVAAQALYQGQGMTARDPAVRDAMQQAAREEIDHLVWCRQRVEQLGSRTSYLNPVWYLGSFSLGALAGALGDKWSLGFLAETEHQVVRHLDTHLERLPEIDMKSAAILRQMRQDELRHATTAVESGAAELPGPVKRMMRLCSRVMTGTAYLV